MVRRVLLISASAVSMASCAPAPDADALPDALLPPEVELITNTSSEVALGLAEDLRLGVVEGPDYLQFHRVGTIAIGSEGALYVANGGSGEVRVFAEDGEFVGSFGDIGDGPGEFRYVTRIVPLDDVVLVFDRRLQRTTKLARHDYSVVETWSALSDHERLSLLGYGSGAFVMEVRRTRRSWPYRVGAPLRDTVQVVASSTSQAGDTTSRVVVEYETGRTFGINSEMAMTANSPLWEPELSAGSDAHGRTFLADGLRYRIDVFDAHGTHVRRVTREHHPVPATERLVERYEESAVEYWLADSLQHGEWQISRAAEVGRVELPREENLPALGRLVVGRDGAFWVERPDLVEDPVLLEWRRGGSQSSYWDVFGEDGAYMGTAQLEAGFTPLAVTGSSLVGVWRSELGVEYVVRRSMTP